MGLDLLKMGMRKNLENGQSINVFKDPWIPRPINYFQSGVDPRKCGGYAGK